MATATRDAKARVEVDLTKALNSLAAAEKASAGQRPRSPA